MGDHRSLTWILMLLCMTTTNLVCGFNLTILHTNDVHGRIQEMNKHNGRCDNSSAAEGECYGGMARIKSKADNFRAKYPNSILLDAGDQYQGSLLFYFNGGEIVARLMDALGYNAMALGNHEFDRGPDGIKPLLDGANYPILSCNIDVTGFPYLAKVKKSVILNVSGESIGIIGYTTSMTPMLSSPGKIKFKDEIKSIQIEVDKLSEKGVNKIIALGHAGYAKDMEIAKKVRGLDVVVGGHSNTFLYTGDPPSTDKPLGLYPTVVKSTDGNQVLVVQDFAYGKYLGFLQVNFDDAGVVTAWNGNPIFLDNSVTKDTNITETIQEYLPKLKQMMNKKVGSSLVKLEGDRRVCRVQECNMGNFLADALIRQNLRYTDSPYWNHVAIALYQGGGIRNSITKGDIELSDVINVLPFGNTIDLIEVTGQVLFDALEHSAANWVPEGDLYGGFMQMSGMRVVYNMKKKVGNRVVKAEALCADCAIPEFHPLNMTKVYKVLLPSFTVKGGDGYTVIRDNIKSHTIGDVDNEVILDYMKNNSHITQGLDGRITFVHDDGDHQPCKDRTAGQNNSAPSTYYNSLFFLCVIYIALCFIVQNF